MKFLSARRLLAAVGITACTFMLYSAWVRIHAIDDIVCHFDATLSLDVQQRIAARAHTLKNSSAEEIVSSLVEQFACVAQCGLQRQPNKQVRITVVSQKPIMCVNESHVLTQAARMVLKSDFDTQATSHLPHITLAQDLAFDAGQLKELHSVIASTDASLFQNFLVSWHTAHEVVLTDRADSRIQFLCCAYQLQNTQLIQRYVGQVAQILAEHYSSAPQKKQWLADVRFENQVILRGSTMSDFGKNVTNGSKGGIHHGTCIS